MSLAGQQRNTAKTRSREIPFANARTFVLLLFAAGPALLLSREVGVTPALPLTTYVATALTIPISLLICLNYGLELLIESLQRFRRLRDEWRLTFRR